MNSSVHGCVTEAISTVFKWIRHLVRNMSGNSWKVPSQFNITVGDEINGLVQITDQKELNYNGIRQQIFTFKKLHQWIFGDTTLTFAR